MLCFFFFNDTATTEIYTLSLHDALPICHIAAGNVDLYRVTAAAGATITATTATPGDAAGEFANAFNPRLRDRKSTRLNSSHANISYAVFCLKKKTTNERHYLHDNYSFTC